MQRIFVNGRKAVILSTNITTTQHKLAFPWLYFPLHLKWEPSENGFLCFRLAPAAQAKEFLQKSESYWE